MIGRWITLYNAALLSPSRILYCFQPQRKGIRLPHLNLVQPSKPILSTVILNDPLRTAKRPPFLQTLCSPLFGCNKATPWVESKQVTYLLFRTIQLFVVRCNSKFRLFNQTLKRFLANKEAIHIRIEINDSICSFSPKTVFFLEDELIFS